MTEVILRDLDQNRVKFEAMVTRVGAGDATKAFSRAINHEGRKTFTLVKRTLVQQTSIPRPVIATATRFRSSTSKNLRVIIEGRGRELPLRLFKPKQFSYGVRATVWGKPQRFLQAFIVKKYSGDVFHRKGKARFPIEGMYGPSVPKEMVKDATLEAFEQSSNGVATRAMHELSRILKV